MPMPNTLPAIDWPAIFEEAKDYEAWLAGSEYEMNREAMEKVYGEFQLEAPFEAFMKALSRDVHVLAVAEDWCPDVIRHVPILQKMASVTPHLKVGYISRESHPEVLVRHLTTGGEAIPKFIFFNHEFVECGSWGPMPNAYREMIARGRAAGDLKTARENVYTLYKSDPTRRVVVEELIHLIDIASCEAP